jgi:hypothetical protein
LMQASLYHFLPDAAPLLDRMLAAARDRVIISEPIRNISSSTNPLLRVLGRRGTDPGAGGHDHRFTEETLDKLLSRYAPRVRRSFLIPGGREKVYVLAGG